MPMLTDIPMDLHSGPVQLRFEKTLPGDLKQGFVPCYHFKILDVNGTIAGHINFRVGETRHVTMTAGHIGYSVLPEYRGSSYSYYACLALRPFILRHYNSVILTVDPDNATSIRTIEKLGAVFIEETDVDVDDPAYDKGARRKRRYKWVP